MSDEATDNYEGYDGEEEDEEGGEEDEGDSFWRGLPQELGDLLIFLSDKLDEDTLQLTFRTITNSYFLSYTKGELEGYEIGKKNLRIEDSKKDLPKELERLICLLSDKLNESDINLILENIENLHYMSYSSGKLGGYSLGLSNRVPEEPKGNRRIIEKLNPEEIMFGDN